MFLFDNSTGHSKMPADALLAQGLRKGPCAKLVGKQRETTWVDSGGITHTQSFLFAVGDELLFEAKGVRANPLGPDGAVRFRVGDVVESVKPGAGDKNTRLAWSSFRAKKTIRTPSAYRRTTLCPA